MEPTDPWEVIAVWELREPMVNRVALAVVVEQRVTVTVWELRDPRESMEPMDPRMAVCVEAKGVKDGSSCVGAKGTEGPMRTK